MPERPNQSDRPSVEGEPDSRRSARLRTQQHRLALALESGGVGLWDLDIVTGEAYWSDSLYELVGRDPSEPVGSLTFFEYIHPDDRPRVRRKADRWFAEGGDFSEEFRVIRSDGKLAWLVARGRIYCNDRGDQVHAVGVNYDVTRRRLAEEALQRSEQLYEALVDNLPGGAVFVLDRDLRYVLVAGQAMDAAGLTREDFIGKTPLEALGPALAEQYEPFFRKVLAGESFVHEHEAHGRHFLSRGVPIRDLDGAVAHVLVVSYDITERKQTEQLLVQIQEDLEQRVEQRTAELSEIVLQLEAEARQRRQAEAHARAERDRLFSVLNKLPGYTVMKNRRYEVVFASHGFLDMFSEPQGRPCYQVQYGLDAPCEDCPMEPVLGTGRADQWQYTYPGGKTFQVWAFPYVDSDGSELLLEFGVDITERKRLEEMVSEMSEAERRRIGRDLHDTLGQTLTGLGYLIGGLTDRLSQALPAERPLCEQLVETIQQATARLRALAHGLDPVGLDSDGLAAALRELADQAKSSPGIACEFECVRPVPLDGQVATHLYRIAQEALNNAAKHAKASEVRITLSEEPDAYVLSVADDGVGIVQPRRDAFGMGMRIMRYRAGAIGGRLQIRSREGKGTVIRCVMPKDPILQMKGSVE